MKKNLSSLPTVTTEAQKIFMKSYKKSHGHTWFYDAVNNFIHSTPDHRRGKNDLARFSALTAKGRYTQAFQMASLFSTIAGDTQRDFLEILKDQSHQRIDERKKNRERFKAVSAENKKLERELATDPLTGVHSRKGLMQTMKQTLSETRRYGRGLTVAILDLNGFKAINDTFGHERGDEALIHVAERLKDALRATDTVGRLSGDEFMIVLPCDGKESLNEDEIRKKILNAFNGMVFWGGDKPYPLTASIGLSVYPPHSESEETDFDTLTSRMMKEADNRMYADKQENKKDQMERATDDAYKIPSSQRCVLPCVRPQVTSSPASKSLEGPV